MTPFNIWSGSLFVRFNFLLGDDDAADADAVEADTDFAFALFSVSESSESGFFRLLISV